LPPLEASFVIAPGAGLASLGAFLKKTRERKLAYWGSALVRAGLAALWGMTAIFGIGRSPGRSPWWALLLPSCPAGWITTLAGAFAAWPDDGRSGGRAWRGNGSGAILPCDAFPHGTSTIAFLP